MKLEGDLRGSAASAFSNIGGSGGSYIVIAVVVVSL